MIQITTSPLPAQEFRCVLDYQYCVISLYQKAKRLYMDLTSGDKPICRGAICQHGTDVVQSVNPEFRGTLHFYDFEGRSAPDWTGLDDRWVLIYLPGGEPFPDWAAR
jgi:hypothetical protein